MSNPTGCSGVKYGCCGTLPEVLMLTVTSAPQNCPCLAVEFPLVYAADTGGWRGRKLITDCTGVSEVSLDILAYCLDNNWFVDHILLSDGCTSLGGWSGSAMCDPFFLSASLMVHTSCCETGGGASQAMNVEITEAA